MVLETASTRKFRNVYRETLVQAPSSQQIFLRRLQIISWTALVLGALAFLATSSSGQASLWNLSHKDKGRTLKATPILREVAAMGFPNLPAYDDQGDILRAYPAYLQYVLAVGNEVDRADAQRLERTYQALRRSHPAAAAMFLKGLRFELVTKLELIGAGPSAISTRTPVMRKWIAKYLREWYHEADEHLFRAVAIAHMRK